jgi:transcriptional regulator with XRE-family HTH domain
VGQRGRKKPKRLGEKLLAIRFKLEVSQSQLAKLLEFDKGVARISEYERGNREPDLNDVAEILRGGPRLYERIG